LIEGPNGKAIPAQSVRHVYYRVGGKLAKLELTGDLYVSHFETCPDAARFQRARARRHG
jgi:hypothetical protein